MNIFQLSFVGIGSLKSRAVAECVVELSSFEGAPPDPYDVRPQILVKLVEGPCRSASDFVWVRSGWLRDRGTRTS
jgi:hypothetical protein